jgi:hypothetical protein
MRGVSLVKVICCVNHRGGNEVSCVYTAGIDVFSAPGLQARTLTPGVGVGAGMREDREGAVGHAHGGVESGRRKQASVCSIGNRHRHRGLSSHPACASGCG